MKRRDEGKASLVDFLASIKTSRSNRSGGHSYYTTQFAHFNQRVRTCGQSSNEDSQLIRSAN